MVEISNLFGLSSTHIQFDGVDVPLNHDTVAVYERLASDAEQRGFGLHAASGYRSFERQAGIWNAKLSGQRPVLDDQGAAIDLEPLTLKERVFAVLRWSALPGTSRHHWGTDFDIYDKTALSGGKLQLTVDETEAGGPFFEMYCWLDSYLDDSGLSLSRPYLIDHGGIAKEPWHISHTPLAQEYEKLLTIELLREIIDASDLMFKETILANLEEIFHRFILNRGVY